VEEVDYEPVKHYNLPLFSESITQNKWVLYHGTSSAFENDILRHGLRSHPIDKHLVERFVEVYERSGIRRISHKVPRLDSEDRYVHLRDFTLAVDFEGENTIKPIYLSDRVNYALTYTQSEYFGGETISAISRCLSALEEYCGNENYRNLILVDLWETMENTYFRRGFAKFLPPHLRDKNSENGTEEDFQAIYDCILGKWRESYPKGVLSVPRSIPGHEELRESLENIRPMVEAHLIPSSSQSYGIVLAVEFEHRDVENFRVRPSGQDHGFAYDGEIGPEKIIGICRVPENAKLGIEADPFHRLQREEDAQDLLHHIKNRES